MWGLFRVGFCTTLSINSLPISSKELMGKNGLPEPNEIALSIGKHAPIPSQTATKNQE
jgi:hypothetical protein